MMVSNIMQREVVTVQPTESVQNAARKMRENNAEVALVFEDGKFEGILTERQITMKTKVDTNEARLSDCNYFSEVAIELLMKK